MDRCVNCLYYDRHGGSGAGGKSEKGGQCRRQAPQLSPNSAKNYLIEGVWPTVRDEDWCGEFKATAAPRRPESTQRADALLGAIGTAAAVAMSASAAASPSTMPRVGAAAAAPSSIGAVRSSTGSD